MRIRKRQVPMESQPYRILNLGFHPAGPEFGHYWGTPAGIVGYVTGQNWNAATIHSNMIDDATKGPFRYKDCLHQQITSNLASFDGAPIDRFDYCPSESGDVAYNYPITPALPVLSLDPFVFGEAAERFWRSGFSDPRLPRKVLIDRDPFDTGFSLWYLIVDIVQMGGLFRKLSSPEVIGRFIKLKGEYRIRKIPPEFTSRDVANSHLAVQFGLIPTLDDMQTFLRILTDWKKVYDNMLELMRKLHNHRFEPVEMEWLRETRSESFVTHIPLFDLPVRLDVETELAVFHRTVQYKFTAPEFQGWISRLKQFIDAFGILDPAAIWDLIPFSFVIDWFIGIGRWLHQNRPRLFPATASITDYCESINLRKRLTWSIGPYWKPKAGLILPGSPTCESHSAFVAGSISTGFVRRRFIPPVERLSAPKVKTSFVSLRRVAISSSLAAQRVPR